MVETKLYRSPEVNTPKSLTEEQKGQSTKTNSYRGNKTWTKTQGPELKSGADFKGWCTNLEGYIFGLGQVSQDNERSGAVYWGNI